MFFFFFLISPAVRLNFFFRTYSALEFLFRTTSTCSALEFFFRTYPAVGGGSAVCTSLQYARVFTYKIIVFENSPNHEIYIKNNENLELRYKKSVSYNNVLRFSILPMVLR